MRDRSNPEHMQDPFFNYFLTPYTYPLTEVSDYTHHGLVRIAHPYDEFNIQGGEEYHHSQCISDKNAHLHMAFNVVPNARRANCDYCKKYPLATPIPGSPLNDGKVKIPFEFFRNNGLSLIGQTIGPPVPYPFY